MSDRKLIPHRFCAVDSDMSVPLVNSPDSASQQQASDLAPEPAIVSADIESEYPRQQD